MTTSSPKTSINSAVKCVLGYPNDAKTALFLALANDLGLYVGNGKKSGIAYASFGSAESRAFLQRKAFIVVDAEGNESAPEWRWVKGEELKPQPVEREEEIPSDLL